MSSPQVLGAGALALTGLIFICDLLKIKKTKRKQQQRSQTIKLCITGGPCGGKSQGINAIYNTFKAIYAPFFIVPEAATIIGSSGLTLNLSNFQPRQIELFQIYLMRLQYNLELIVGNVAKTMQKLEKAPVILCDRGLLDGKAYAGDKNWAQMLKHIKITEHDILSRYKAVIHMETAARGAVENYLYVVKQQAEQEQGLSTIKEQLGQDSSSCNDQILQKEGANKVRIQPPQQAIDLDEKIQRCYIHHPYRFIIKNTFFVNDFQMKKLLLVAQVNQILEFVLKLSNVENYYKEYEMRRKYSEDEDDNNISPYLIRKRKYQKFLTRDRSGSPPKRK